MKTNLVIILFGYFANFLEKRWPLTQAQFLPNQVGDFKLQKPLLKQGRWMDYQFGLYQNSQGQKALGKIWSGRFKNSAYWTLMHEIEIAKVIHLLTTKNSVAIPQVLEVHNNSTQLVVLFEWIPSARPLRTTSLELQQRAYLKTLKYFKVISSQLSTDQKKSLPSRSGWQLALLYPMLLLKSITTYPHHYRKLLKGSLVLLRSLPYLVRQSAHKLTHRDLNPGNILLSKHKIFIIDHAYTTLSIPFYEIILMVTICWNKQSIRNKLISSLRSELKTIEQARYVKGLGVYAMTHFLTENRLSDDFANTCQQGLEYWMSVRVEELITPRVTIEKSVPVPHFILKVLHIGLDYLGQLTFQRNQPVYSQSLPEKLGEYKLIKPLIVRPINRFSLGVYQNRSGQAVIVKLWSGRRPNILYYALLHEAVVYQVLTQIRQRIRATVPNRFKMVRLPKFFGWVATEAYAGVMIEYCEGVTVASLSKTSDQLHKYHQALDYLRWLGHQSTQSELKQIGIRSSRYFVTIFPFIWLIAWLKNPVMLATLWQGFIVWIQVVPTLIHQQTSTLVHGDLHGENLLIVDDDIVILDLEQTMVTVEFYEMITTLSSIRNRVSFRNHLTKQFLKNHLLEPKIWSIFRALVIQCSIYNLTSQMSPANTRLYTQLLQWGIKKNINVSI